VGGVALLLLHVLLNRLVLPLVNVNVLPGLAAEASRATMREVTRGRARQRVASCVACAGHAAECHALTRGHVTTAWLPGWRARACCTAPGGCGRAVQRVAPWAAGCWAAAGVAAAGGGPGARGEEPPAGEGAGGGERSGAGARRTAGGRRRPRDQCCCVLPLLLRVLRPPPLHAGAGGAGVCDACRVAGGGAHGASGHGRAAARDGGAGAQLQLAGLPR
jgi:hypothetical protein